MGVRAAIGAEAREAGKEFESIMDKSLLRMHDVWFTRLRDGKGAERPADTLALFPSVRMLMEYKRTKSERFSLSLIEKVQIEGLVNFEKAGINNYGLVFVNFYNMYTYTDYCFCFRLVHLLHWLVSNKKTSNYNIMVA